MGSAAASIPNTVAVPEVGGSWPLSICRVVVLPAPLRPIKLKNSPYAIRRSRLSTAVSLPNCFVRACASICIKKSPFIICANCYAAVRAESFLGAFREGAGDIILNTASFSLIRTYNN